MPEGNMESGYRAARKVSAAVPLDQDPVRLGHVAAWLAAWAGQARAVGLTPMPDAITAHLSAELKAAQARLTPSDAPTMAVTLARLAVFARSFSLPLDDIAATVAIYRDALADLPGDLLMDGVARTIAGHRYHNMPKPGDIRARIEGELITRRARLAHARLALSRSRRQGG